MAFVAALALLHFSSQVIVHAAAAFEAAFDFTSFRSLLTGPAASALASFAMRIWNARIPKGLASLLLPFWAKGYQP